MTHPLINLTLLPMKKLLLLLSAGAALILSACTTIEITERDAFDAHRTITPATFHVPPFEFRQAELQTEDGETLDAWYITQENAVATVAYFGGNGHLMVKSRALIHAYSTVPVNLLLFDYRGYGLSTGDPSVMGVQQDTRTAFRFAEQLAEESGTRLFVHGHSMGSFLAAMIADENRVDGYILESPVTEVRTWTRRLVPWILRPFIRFDIEEPIRNQSNLDRVRSVDAPLLILAGTADEVTPIRMAEELLEASVSPSRELIRISGGGHNNLPEYSSYRIALNNFLVP
ncbi:MAG: alpha/beta fold hydrolase [Balneolaceae bacterium]|nr:MAG: alpha/beta fold hydrolase [Balneolaceae bacterium]